jgi:hypothetical protein
VDIQPGVDVLGAALVVVLTNLARSQTTPRSRHDHRTPGARAAGTRIAAPLRDHRQLSGDRTVLRDQEYVPSAQGPEDIEVVRMDDDFQALDLRFCSRTHDRRREGGPDAPALGAVHDFDRELCPAGGDANVSPDPHRSPRKESHPGHVPTVLHIHERRFHGRCQPRDRYQVPKGARPFGQTVEDGMQDMSLGRLHLAQLP